MFKPKLKIISISVLKNNEVIRYELDENENLNLKLKRNKRRNMKQLLSNLDEDQPNLSNINSNNDNSSSNNIFEEDKDFGIELLEKFDFSDFSYDTDDQEKKEFITIFY